MGTLLSAAGFDSDAVITGMGGEVDGVNQWDALMSPASVSLDDASSLPRSEIMHDIDFMSINDGQTYARSDEVMAAFTRVVKGKQYKVLTATSIGGYGQPFTEDIYDDDEDVAYYLFDLSSDPLETNNLWDNADYTALKSDLLTGMCEYYTAMVSPVFAKSVDTRSFWAAVNSTKENPKNATELGFLSYWHNDYSQATPTYSKDEFERTVGVSDETSSFCPFTSSGIIHLGSKTNMHFKGHKFTGRIGSKD